MRHVEESVVLCAKLYSFDDVAFQTAYKVQLSEASSSVRGLSSNLRHDGVAYAAKNVCVNEFLMVEDLQQCHTK